ncbi:polymeric immunoglobulin receptor-like isoform X1 [Tyto alba]|uniref:polymeric immunoglobulin receptor-like isoform X1 n=1 Tax=Tyto alba TaxID=56313 RepID=UPI001C67BAFB|nr:polymeric immunoglobulin receptor-like isoform X1 [Tyto alba]
MVLLFLLAALLQEPVSSTLYGSRFLTGEVGGSIAHQCFYSITPANKHDRKYWCKIAGNRVCYTIISTTGYTSKDYVGRVYLEDIPENGTFAVTMTELKKSDTGTYRCGIGPTNRDLYVSLNLTVLADASVLGPIELVWGKLRGSVTVLCPSGDSQSGKKRFWCKLGRTGCALIADTDGYVEKSYEGRIFITPQESSGAFKILINDLKREDSGLYRCGMGRLSGRDGPRVVALQVTAASTFPKRPKFLSGTVGGSLSVKCHYDPEGNYDKKYLCRWKEASCELLVDEDGFVHESYKGRIQIASSDQENGTYTVVMSHLREEDAGWYWCGAKNGHTEHTSSVKLRIQKETFSSQDPETSTLVTSTLSSPATYSTTTQRSITGLTYTMGTVTEITSTPLPTAPPGTFVTSPGKIYSRESSSSKSRLLPVVLSALILLIFITIAIFILAKIKLQKDTGEERTTIENLEAASVGAGLNPEKEQTMEETPSPEKVHKCRTDSGKRGWAFSGTGTARVISMIEENKNKF